MKQADLVLGYDVGGSTIRLALFDKDLNVQHRLRRSLLGSHAREAHAVEATAGEPAAVVEAGTVAEGDAHAAGEYIGYDPAEVVRVMVAMYEELGSPEIVAIGVGIAGQLDRTGGVVLNAPNLSWRGVRFQEILQQSFGAPVVLVNDLNAILVGEHQGGGARGYEEVLGVYVGTGVGGGLIQHGELYTGGSGVAGELGHVKVEVEGRRCGCGQRGCLEAYASGRHLTEQLRDLMEQPAVAEVLGAGEVGGGSSAAGAGEVGGAGGAAEVVGAVIDSGELLRRADRIAAEAQVSLDSKAHGASPICSLWERATDLLAVSIANAVTVCNPSLLLLGGGVLENLPYFRKRTMAKIDGLVLEAALLDLTIAMTELGGDEAGVLGAATVALRDVSGVVKGP